MIKVKKVLIYIVIIEAMLVSVLMTISICRLWARYDELLQKTSQLEERINNIAISNRLQYEDILDIIER